VDGVAGLAPDVDRVVVRVLDGVVRVPVLRSGVAAVPRAVRTPRDAAVVVPVDVEDVVVLLKKLPL